MSCDMPDAMTDALAREGSNAAPAPARREGAPDMVRYLPAFMLITDISFVLYWTMVFFRLLPDEYLFSDYKNPVVSDWNYSFYPLDLLISLTGLVSIALWRRGADSWRPLCLVSLTLTFCSGLQAIAFWALRGEFDLGWWAVNIFLMIYPVVFSHKLVAQFHGKS